MARAYTVSMQPGFMAATTHGTSRTAHCRGDLAQIPGIGLGAALVRRNVGGRVAHAVINDVAPAARAGAGRLPAW